MNPQPPVYIGQLIALGMIFVMLYYAIKAHYDTSTSGPSDLFTLGYIEENQAPVNVVVKTKIPKQQKPIVKVVVNNQPKLENTQLFIDCVDALYALGMKKRDAIKRAKDIFASSSTPPKSVQEFLIIALRN
jgi:hypothetical protein